jgi:hypothetical protein
MCSAGAILVNQYNFDSIVQPTFGAPGAFDNSGVIYGLATKDGTRKYCNPHTHDAIVADISSASRLLLFNQADPQRFVQHQGMPGSMRENITKNEKGSWMSVDIGKDRTFLLNHYCLRHGNDSASEAGGCLRSWQLQGSLDGSTWVVLSTHKHDKSLHEKAFSVAHWEVKESTACRHFRIMQTGKNSSGKNYLCCAGIELYGEMYSESLDMLRENYSDSLDILETSGDPKPNRLVVAAIGAAVVAAAMLGD